MSTNRVTDLSPLDSCRQLRCVDSLCQGAAHASKAGVACRTLAMHRNSLEDLDGCMATLGTFSQLSGESATLLLRPTVPVRRFVLSSRCLCCTQTWTSVVTLSGSGLSVSIDAWQSYRRCAGTMMKK
jgi:hypothetical protein|eukprot:COSAG02_NODE_1498_length_12281_cov_14.846741_4_plen_127_part_00